MLSREYDGAILIRHVDWLLPANGLACRLRSQAYGRARKGYSDNSNGISNSMAMARRGSGAKIKSTSLLANLPMARSPSMVGRNMSTEGTVSTPKLLQQGKQGDHTQAGATTAYWGGRCGRVQGRTMILRWTQLELRLADSRYCTNLNLIDRNFIINRRSGFRFLFQARGPGPEPALGASQSRRRPNLAASYLHTPAY